MRKNCGSQLGELPPDIERQRRIARPPLPTVTPDGKWINNIRFAQIGRLTTLESIQYAPANFGRKYLLIQNKGVSGIYLAFDTVATVLNGIFIDAGGNYEPYVVPNGSINILGVAVNISVLVVEGN